LERICRRLARRLDEVETLARENRRTLEVQFKRIATIQGELDVLVADRRRRGRPRVDDDSPHADGGMKPAIGGIDG
jgi:hypothetical protein